MIVLDWHVKWIVNMVEMSETELCKMIENGDIEDEIKNCIV